MSAKARGVRRRRKRAPSSDAARSEGESLVTEVLLGKTSNPIVVFGVLALCALGATILTAQMVASTVWMIPAGVTLFLSVALVSKTEPTVVSVTGDIERGTLTLALNNGESATIPRATVDQPKVVRGQSSNKGGRPTYRVAFDLHDGGQLALRSFGSGEAPATVAARQLGLLLDHVPADQREQEELIAAARNRLEGCERVSVEQAAPTANYRGTQLPALTLSWSLATSFRQLAALPLVVGGMITMILGMLNRHDTGPQHALIAIGLLTAVAAFFHLRKSSSRIQVRIDENGTLIEQTRGGSVVNTKELSTMAIQAIDANWVGPLFLRLDEADESVQRLRAAGTTSESRIPVLTIVRSIWSIIRHRVTLETGLLSLQERLDLELVLSAEIARRSGRSAAEI